MRERTKNCIKCGKKANIWTGHVVDRSRSRRGHKIIAGWCKSCRKKHAGTAEYGYYGDYKKFMS